MTDLFQFKSNSDAAPPKSNVPEFSVGELALSLKRTLEENFGRIRVRGELSRVSIASSGHMYSVLKDDNAVIDAVCWKGVLAGLSVRPEEGLEVICVGRISSYPKSSKYQLIIESMELAGEGALLKMLEERRKKLASEGLFDDQRKKSLPFLPQVIGVVTSPTGAVIRDILHRLQDRFPRHVLVWPVLVQGDGAADQIAKAIAGFDDILPDSEIPKPDLIIVARGGGSLEDLMAFNEENVVRAIANCRTPIISAVGHETDTTLADYAADYRAPTPTGAAEIAVPRRTDLMARILDDEKRLFNGLNRALSEKSHKFEALRAKLGDPAKLLESHAQTLDFQGEKLKRVFAGYIQTKETHLHKLAGQIQHPRMRVENAAQRLDGAAQRLLSGISRAMSELHHRFEQTQARLGDQSKLLESHTQTISFQGEQLKRAFSGYVQTKETHLHKLAGHIQSPRLQIENAAQRLDNISARLIRTMPQIHDKKNTQFQALNRLLHSLSYEEILKRGYVVVRDADDKPVSNPDMIIPGQELVLEFAGERRIGVQSKGDQTKQRDTQESLL